MSWTISTDAKVAALSSDTCRLLFTWMIAHGDNLGRMPGEPGQIRALVAPRLSLTDAQTGRFLAELAGHGLIVWYSHDGMRYVGFPKDSWKRHQRLHHTLSRHSDFPAPSREAHVSLTQTSRDEVEVEVEVEKEVEETPLSAGADGSNGVPADFKAWYDAFPHKIDPKDALKAWRQMLRKGATVERIIAGTQPWLLFWNLENTEAKFIKAPGPWLRAERYLQTPPASNGHASEVGMPWLSKYNPDGSLKETAT